MQELSDWRPSASDPKGRLDCRPAYNSQNWGSRISFQNSFARSAYDDLMRYQYALNKHSKAIKEIDTPEGQIKFQRNLARRPSTASEKLLGGVFGRPARRGNKSASGFQKELKKEKQRLLNAYEALSHDRVIALQRFSRAMDSELSTAASRSDSLKNIIHFAHLFPEGERCFSVNTGLGTPNAELLRVAQADSLKIQRSLAARIKSEETRIIMASRSVIKAEIEAEPHFHALSHYWSKYPAYVRRAYQGTTLMADYETRLGVMKARAVAERAAEEKASKDGKALLFGLGALAVLGVGAAILMDGDDGTSSGDSCDEIMSKVYKCTAEWAETAGQLGYRSCGGIGNSFRVRDSGGTCAVAYAPTRQCYYSKEHAKKNLCR